jgi:hypothetical protein
MRRRGLLTVFVCALVAGGCGGGSGDKPQQRAEPKPAAAPAAPAAPTDRTVAKLEPLVRCLSEAGGDVHLSSQRPKDDSINYRTMTRAAGFQDLMDVWRSSGDGFYLLVYDSYDHAVAAISAQRDKDNEDGYTGINADMRAEGNVAVGPDEQVSAAHKRQLDHCIVAAAR